MSGVNRTFALVVALLQLSGCTQTLLLTSDNSASATVKSPPIHFGTARFTVVMDGKTYVGSAGELREDTSGTQSRRFGWAARHKHPNIRQEMKFLFGSSMLAAADGGQLECDHLRHGDDWRLICKKPAGAGEVQLQRHRP